MCVGTYSRTASVARLHVERHEKRHDPRRTLPKLLKRVSVGSSACGGGGGGRHSCPEVAASHCDVSCHDFCELWQVQAGEVNPTFTSEDDSSIGSHSCLDSLCKHCITVSLYQKQLHSV